MEPREQITITCRTPADTRQLARELTKCLKPKDVVLLRGQLGAGKTAFAQGMANAFGVREHVVSPTFSIAQEYKTARTRFNHIDLYRLAAADLDDLGLEETLEEGITAIEWPERIHDIRRYVTDHVRLFFVDIKINGRNREFTIDHAASRCRDLRALGRLGRTDENEGRPRG